MPGNCRYTQQGQTRGQLFGAWGEAEKMCHGASVDSTLMVRHGRATNIFFNLTTDVFEFLLNSISYYSSCFSCSFYLVSDVYTPISLHSNDIDYILSIFFRTCLVILFKNTFQQDFRFLLGAIVPFPKKLGIPKKHSFSFSRMKTASYWVRLICPPPTWIFGSRESWQLVRFLVFCYVFCFGKPR